MTPFVDANSFHVRKINIGRHAGAQSVVVVRQADFDAEDLTDSVLHGLYIARRKLGLAVHLLDDTVEIFARKRIDADSNLFADFDQTKPRLGNINAHAEMPRQEP